ARAARGSPSSKACCRALELAWVALTLSIALDRVLANPGASATLPALPTSIALEGATSACTAPVRISWARIWERIDEMASVIALAAGRSAGSVWTQAIPVQRARQKAAACGSEPVAAGGN